MAAIDQATRWVKRQNAPYTLFMAISLLVAAVVFFFTNGSGMQYVLLSSKPFMGWTLLTYPWAFPASLGFGGLIFTLFLLGWMFQTGSLAESEMGAGRYIAFVMAMSVLTGIFVVFVPMAWGGGGVLAGPWPIVTVLTVLWAARNPLSPVCLMGFITVQARVVAFLMLASFFFTVGVGNIAGGVLGLIPMALTWAFAAGKLPIAYAPTVVSESKTRFQIKNENKYFEDVRKREQERQEREKLKKLFEASMIGDPDDKK